MWVRAKGEEIQSPSQVPSIAADRAVWPLLFLKMSKFYVSVSFAALHVGSSVPSF